MKKLIQIEIECADDGMHCGGCEFKHCPGTDYYKCYKFLDKIKNPTLLGHIPADPERLPACIAAEVRETEKPFTRTCPKCGKNFEFANNAPCPKCWDAEKAKPDLSALPARLRKGDRGVKKAIQCFVPFWFGIFVGVIILRFLGVNLPPINNDVIFISLLWLYVYMEMVEK